MKRLMIAVALASLAGCGYNHSVDTTPRKTHATDLDRNIAGQTVSSSTERTKSDWEDCMEQNRGFDGAKQQCDAWMVADKGPMPRYQGWGWYPYYSGYPGGYSQQPYVTPGMLYR